MDRASLSCRGCLAGPVVRHWSLRASEACFPHSARLARGGEREDQAVEALRLAGDGGLRLAVGSAICGRASLLVEEMSWREIAAVVVGGLEHVDER